MAAARLAAHTIPWLAYHGVESPSPVARPARCAGGPAPRPPTRSAGPARAGPARARCGETGRLRAAAATALCRAARTGAPPPPPPAAATGPCSAMAGRPAPGCLRDTWSAPRPPRPCHLLCPCQSSRCSHDARLCCSHSSPTLVKTARAACEQHACLGLVLSWTGLLATTAALVLLASSRPCSRPIQCSSLRLPSPRPHQDTLFPPPACGGDVA
jgi:hypothetical protein